MALAAEMVGNLAGPGPAEMAGTPEMQAEERVYGLLHYDNADGDHVPVMEAFREETRRERHRDRGGRGVHPRPGRAQENARTNIGQLMDAGVTTILYYGDPLTPASLTTEATAQGTIPSGSSVPTC